MPFAEAKRKPVVLFAPLRPTRGLSETDIANLAENRIERRLFGFIGALRMNVLQLDLAPDARET